MFNSIPFCYRHVYFLIIIFITYALFSIAYTKIKGEYIDEIFDWTTLLGWLLPFAVLFLSIALYYVISKLTYFKICKLDGEENDILMIIKY